MKIPPVALGFAALLSITLAGRPVAGQAPPGASGVPVSVTQVVRQDVPIWIKALGTAQASYSVQVRTQVDGKLLSIPVTEGQTVKAGELLAAIDPRLYQAALDGALGKKQQDEAQLANAQADLARYESLARRDFASRQQVDTQKAQVKQITALIAIDNALVETAQVNLNNCAITAPFDGRVGLRMVDPGSFVRAAEATPILPLAQLQPIAVTFTVPQDNLPAIQRAMAKGKPTVIAFASDDRTELERGALLTIDNAIDPTTGTIKMKALFPNSGSALWPGQFVNTRLLAGTDTNVLTIPSAAVQHGQDRLYVYVVKDDQTADIRTVEVARDDGKVAVIAKGLEAGQVVVTDGHSRLRSGIRVSTIGGAPGQAGG
jgi:membrane fusion protein, multidrug efflux system